MYRIFYHGKEITNDCFAADDEEGWADVYLLNDKGDFYAEWDENGEGNAVTDRLHGKIDIVAVREES